VSTSAARSVGGPGWAIFLAAALFSAGCGYRLVARGTLPENVRRVRVVPPNPHRTDEPSLSAELAAGLEHELSRAGIRVVFAGRSEAILVPRILDLETVRLQVGASSAIAARVVRLRAEFLLEDPAGRTLWRSGLVEAEAAVPLSESEPRGSAQARRVGLATLAAKVARQAVDQLTSGL
jgi:hypothetical protein